MEAQMRTFATLGVLALLGACPAAAELCGTSADGGSIYCGSISGRKVGGTTYWSDGSTTSHVGATSSHNDGSTNSLKSNAPLMPPGSTFTHHGDRTSSDGRTCSHIGVTSFCN
jgi:hypothetical protein